LAVVTLLVVGIISLVWQNEGTTQGTSPTAAQLIVLYQENGADGWAGWNGTADWSVGNGMLNNDGTNSSHVIGPRILAPYRPSGTSYAVEATVRVLNTSGNCFGITILGMNSTSGWHGYQGAVNLKGNCHQ
jgi:hypothetical protein